MDRYWLLTWTCYGTWLSGDRRRFVGNVREPDGTQVTHDSQGTPYDRNMPGLEAWVRDHMKGDPVSLDDRDADVLLHQYRETARVRGWSLEAASVMFNHTHLVVGVPGDPEPDRIRDAFKSWATRALKEHRPLPPNGAFWTVNGSKRKLSNVRSAVVYVTRKQPDPLGVWFDERWKTLLDEYDR